MERIIARHCAPALAGIKPANLVACHKDKIKDIHEQIGKLNFELNKKDIYLRIVHECERRALIIVYRRKQLEEYLRDVEISRFLSAYGYPEKVDAERYIDYLKQRLLEDEFPHEIGAFLGYPINDIYGFINHKSEGCLLCGEWKVYDNVENAKKLFKRFADCRSAVVKRLDMGQSLAQVFGAA